MPLTFDALSIRQASVVAADRTTTLQTAVAVTDLSFLINPNQTWIFEVYAKIGTSSIAGNKYAVTIPAAATMMVQVRGTLATVAAESSDTMTVSGTLGATFNTANLAAVPIGANISMQGRVTTGANGGTVQIMQAKVTSGTATVYLGSWIVAFRVS